MLRGPFVSKTCVTFNLCLSASHLKPREGELENVKEGWRRRGSECEEGNPSSFRGDGPAKTASQSSGSRPALPATRFYSAALKELLQTSDITKEEPSGT